MPKKQLGNKKNKQSNFAKLSIFQPNKYKFKKTILISTFSSGIKFEIDLNFSIKIFLIDSNKISDILFKLS